MSVETHCSLVCKQPQTNPCSFLPMLDLAHCIHLAPISEMRSRLWLFSQITLHPAFSVFPQLYLCRTDFRFGVSSYFGMLGGGAKVFKSERYKILQFPNTQSLDDFL